jgi:hypothetical protein
MPKPINKALPTQVGHANSNGVKQRVPNPVPGHKPAKIVDGKRNFSNWASSENDYGTKMPRPRKFVKE